MPMHAIPGQSMPILANPCQSFANRGSSFHSAKSPISANMCQSKVNVSAKHTFSDPAPIQAQLFNNFQRPIHTNHGQFITNPTPTQSHSADAVPIWASSPPPIQRPSCTASLSVQVMQHQPRTCIHQCIETESRLAQQWQRFPQSRTIRCQFHAIYEDICLDNQGTSLLYGMVPSLLGGQNSSHLVTIPCQLGSTLLQTVNRSQVNPAPIRCQSRVKPGSFQTQHSRSTTTFQ